MTTNPTSDRRGSTPVPPRAKKGRPAGGGNNRKARQAQQAAQRRNRLLAYGLIGVVVVVIVALVLVKVAGGGSSGTLRSPLPATASAKLDNVQLPVLTAAASKVPDLQPATPATGGASSAPGGPGASLGGAKPEILYIGAEFCPICATERWPLYIALSHFGTFSNVSKSHSAVQDGNIPTLSFYGSTYTSNYLKFTPVETYTNQPSGNYYSKLETPTANQQAIWTAAQGSNLTFPFIDMGGKLQLTTSQFPSNILEGKSFNDVLNAVGDNSNTVGADIDASAAVLTKYFCGLTKNAPANVCSAVANVSVPAASGSGSATPAG